MKLRYLAACLLLIVAATGVQAQDVESLHRRLFPATPPSTPFDPELDDVLNRSGSRRVHAVVVFAQPLSQTQREQIRAKGVELESSLGRNAYVVSLVGPATRLRELPNLRSATTIRPREKLSPALAAGEHPRWAFDPETRRIKVLVELHRDATPRMIRDELIAMGLDQEDLAALGISVRLKRHGPRTVALELTRSELDTIAKADSVKRIQHGPIPFLPLNDSVRDRIHTDEAQQADLTSPQPSYGLSGVDVKIGICDEGIDEDHDDFDEVEVDGSAGDSRVEHPRHQPSEHGTHVASIAAGSGFNSAGYGSQTAFNLRGHAPSARIADYDSFSAELDKWHKALAEDQDSTDVTNHSYVQSLEGYDAIAMELDLIVRGDAEFNGEKIPAKPQVWAAGNSGVSAKYEDLGAMQSGYHSVFTSAKNTISVGSIDAKTGRLSYFSSLGPTFDGRIKPDLVAPGCFDSSGWGISAAKVNSQRYMARCGTSMAAPVVTGVIGLMMEQYQKSYGKPPDLLPSTYKAMLVHTAEDLTKGPSDPSDGFYNPDTRAHVLYGRGPDFATGWGMVHAKRAVEIVTLENQWKEDAIEEVSEEQGFIELGKVDIWCLEVPDGANEVRATIAWDDVPGDTIVASFGGSLLKNDLDLELWRPSLSGDPIHPWTIEALGGDPKSQGEIAGADRGVDRRNNVEMATWDKQPLEGIWRVRVHGAKLLDGTTQRYSLVTSHPISPCPRPPYPRS